jgi:hypothetical protein
LFLDESVDVHVDTTVPPSRGGELLEGEDRVVIERSATPATAAIRSTISTISGRSVGSPR